MHQQAHKKMGHYLTTIKREIVNRTRASSAGLVRGEQVDLLMTSIFDRSSSSSEAGPDTPGTFQSAQAPWHDDEIFEDALDELPRLDHSIQRFTPRSIEDIGYESGREDGQACKFSFHST